jgi:F-box-like
MVNREKTSKTSPSRRDSRAIASTLPVELLQVIFSNYAEYKDLYVKWCNSRPVWVAVTHFCRRWRAAALSCSSLWTSINTLRLAKG